MNITTQAFRKAQYAYDTAEPDYDTEADRFDAAVEREIESAWSIPQQIVECFAYEGLKLSLEAAELLCRHRTVKVSRGRQGRPLLPHEFALLADAIIDLIDPVAEKLAERCVRGEQ